MRANPSASNLSAAALCPGKPNLERGLAEIPNEFSERGTELHKYFQTDADRSILSSDDRELMERSDRLCEQFLAQFKSDHEITDEEPCVIEHEVQLNGIVPGRPDVVMKWRDGEIVCVLDFKSGLIPVDEAADNYQLSDYALLVFEETNFLVCGVAIIQPDALGARTSAALYRRDSMAGVSKEIARIYLETVNPDARRVAGEKQCHWCKAKAKCPEYSDKVFGVEVAQKFAVSGLPNEQLEALKRAIAFGRKIEPEVNAEMRARIRSGALTGWELGNTGSVRELIDAVDGFERLNAWLVREACPPLTAAAYDACRTMSWGKLEELFQRTTGLSKKKASDAIRDILAESCVETEKEKSIKESKPKPNQLHE